MAKKTVISLIDLPNDWLEESRRQREEARAERVREVVRKRVRARQAKRRKAKRG